MGGAQEEYTNEFLDYIEFEDEIEDYPYWLVKCYSTRREAEKCYGKAVELKIPAILFEPLRRDLYYVVALYGDDKKLIEIGFPGIEAYAGQIRVLELLKTHLIMKSNISSNIDEIIAYIKNHRDY